ncbi:MAG: prepilin-type N-terminal cleavage/methylation domain-containing protein [Phycisphaerae bacterium]
MNTKKNKKGFTLAELLTAIAIIAILIGILLPALNMARNFAKTTRQKVQLSSIEVGINMFKNDAGYYPPSHGNTNATPPAADYTYYGAQTLAEAMFGMDLLGFHLDSTFYSGDTTSYPAAPSDANIKKRKALYIDRTNLGVFKLRDVFQTGSDNRYLICDTFETVNWPVTLASGSPSTKNYKMGTPILYFRANTSSLNIDVGTAKNDRIYDYQDNEALIGLGTVKDGTVKHLDFTESTGTANFLTYIKDVTASTASRDRPVKPDSFLLISAGPDGLYGTTDDICNFEPNIQ